MQNAYASYQVMQLMGRFSWVVGVVVQVGLGKQEVRRLPSHVLSDVERFVFHAVCHPGSAEPASVPTARRPASARRYACLPDPAEGIHPPITALTNWRNRPTVTAYSSRRNPLLFAAECWLL